MIDFSQLSSNHIIGALVGGVVVYLWLKARNIIRRGRALRFDVSNAENQLRFVQQGDFSPRRPINKEAYQSVFVVAEKHLSTLHGNYRIFAEVAMGSFLKTPYLDYGWQPKEKWKEKANNERAFRSINSKRVDFLIIDAIGMPRLVIEYQGSGHYQGNAEERDIVKQRALENAGVPMLAVFPDTPPEEIKRSISEYLYR